VQKEEIIAAIRKCAQELGRTPSLGELTERVHVSTRTIRKLFGNYGIAVRACGMEPPRGAPTPLADLFEDWAGVVRKLESCRRFLVPFTTFVAQWTAAPKFLTLP
jgi:hypothetical protein